MTTKIYNLYKAYAFIVMTIFAYLLLRFNFNFSDYFALIIANVTCLAFLQVYDIKEDLKLEKLKAKFNEQSKKEDRVVFDYSKIVTYQKDKPITLNLFPELFFGYTAFVQSFSLKYIVEDTDKFISTFSERLKHQFYINIAVSFFAFILFKPAPETSIIDYQVLLNDPKELLKVAFTIFGTILNIIFLWRPFWFCRERNKTFLNN